MLAPRARALLKRNLAGLAGIVILQQPFSYSQQVLRGVPE
jgi:hypothetical protein